MPDVVKMEQTVHDYVDAFARGDAAAVAALFAADATVEDPVGTPPHVGQAAILAFYTAAMRTGARLTLEGPVRIAADTAAFAFSVLLDYAGGAKRIDVIDTFRFNDENRVIEMRAFWGPGNMHGF